MGTSIHDLFQQLITQWLESGRVPDAPMEGVDPEFARLQSVHPEEFTFDSLLHQTDAPDWAWKRIEFSDHFEAPFFFYLPIAWSEVRKEGSTALVGDAARPRQQLCLGQKSSWHEWISTLLEGARVVAFAYYPLHAPEYHQWIFVTAATDERPIGTFAAYDAGDWLVTVQGEASTPSELTCQLLALINSSP